MSDQSFHMTRWCEDTWPGLYRFIYSRVQNRQEAEDLTQETYVRIFAQRHEQTEPVPSHSYLHTIALNLIRDRWRRRKTRGVPLPLEEKLFLQSDESGLALDRAWLQSLLGQLNEEQQTVLRLRLIEGYTRAETAKRMGRSENSVRGLQYRALLSLRSLMHEHMQAQPFSAPTGVFTEEGSVR